MSNKVSPIPQGYHSLTPYLILSDATAAIDFYKKAFGAIEIMRMPAPNNRIGHAEMKIGDSIFMLADECMERDAKSPSTIGGSAISLHLYVPDVDAIAKQAVEAGAKMLKPIENMFYGDRNGMLEDPFGHKWCVSTHIEDLSPQEIQQRMAEMVK
ncbi:MAG TPA: VOC family protein [Gammaproteobacteria bacterium]|nr:VOC family protein [Gammaproteobacteria bacterium]